MIQDRVSSAATRRTPVPLEERACLPLPLDDAALDTPAMLIDLDIMESNIAAMATYASRAGVALRPHAKTHKSAAIADRQVAAGAVGLCVATTSEALVLAQAGVHDLTLAYPLVGERKLLRVADALTSAEVTLVADSEDVVAGYSDLARRCGRQIRVLAEIDTGMHRVGVPPGSARQLASCIEGAPGLRFGGILTHAGHAHDTASQLAIESVARHEATIMGDLRTELEKAGFEVGVVSAGSTLTARHLSAADGITEIRPGTYVFNDLRTLGCWSCTADQLAVTMLSTVVSVDGSRVTVDAGSKTLTTTIDAVFGAGHLYNRPESRFTRVSEEHGVLEIEGEKVPSVGDRVRILPIHVCVWTDLQPEVYGIRSNRVVERITVDAARHSL